MERKRRNRDTVPTGGRRKQGTLRRIQKATTSERKPTTTGASLMTHLASLRQSRRPTCTGSFPTVSSSSDTLQENEAESASRKSEFWRATRVSTVLLSQRPMAHGTDGRVVSLHSSYRDNRCSAVEISSSTTFHRRVVSPTRRRFIDGSFRRKIPAFVSLTHLAAFRRQFVSLKGSRVRFIDTPCDVSSITSFRAHRLGRHHPDVEPLPNSWRFGYGVVQA